MTDPNIDELGPVDYLVVEFPLGKADFKGEAAQELKSLVDKGIIRVLDLIFIHKLEDGSIEAFEAHEYDQAGVLAELDALALELLAEEDVDALAAAVEPEPLQPSSCGRTRGRRRSALRCVAPAASSSPTAVSPCKESLPRSMRTWPRWKEPKMPLGPGRAGRRGVVGAPVARTAAVVGTTAVVAHGVRRRGDRRDDRRDDRQDRR